MYMSAHMYLLDFNTRLSYSIKKGYHRVLPMVIGMRLAVSSGQARNKVSAWGHWQPLDTSTLPSCFCCSRV